MWNNSSQITSRATKKQDSQHKTRVWIIRFCSVIIPQKELKNIFDLVRWWQWQTIPQYSLKYWSFEHGAMIWTRRVSSLILLCAVDNINNYLKCYWHRRFLIQKIKLKKIRYYYIQRWPHRGCEKTTTVKASDSFSLCQFRLRGLWWSIYLRGFIELGGLSISCNYFWLMGGFHVLWLAWLIEFYLCSFLSWQLWVHLITLSFCLLIFINLFLDSLKKVTTIFQKYLLNDYYQLRKYLTEFNFEREQNSWRAEGEENI